MNTFQKLKKFKLFDGLNDDELLDIINKKSIIKKYPKNSIILNQGDSIDFMGLLLSGEINLVIENIFCKNTIISKLSPPALFAESFILAGISEIPHTIVSSIDSEILFFKYKLLKDEAYKEKINSNLLKIIANKNIFLRGKLNILSLPTTRDKIMQFLNEESIKNDSKYFKIKYSITELSEYIHINRSSLSRELSKMKEDGLIDYDKHIFRILK